MPIFFLYLIAVSLIAGQSHGAETEVPAAPAISRDAPDRFTEDPNGTILDNATGLMWFSDGNIAKLPLPKQAAEHFIQNMNRGINPNGGYTNWRMPTVGDLESLIDRSRSYPALPRNFPIKNPQNELYWSSSTGADIVEYVWTIDLATGTKIADNSSLCNFRFFLPVRNTWKSTATDQGLAYAGGVNKVGQLGDGGEADRASFMPIRQPSSIVRTAAGQQHILAVNADGTVWAWGDNRESQLGTSGSAVESRTPILVQGMRTVIEVAAGGSHSLALKADGTVWAWGRNTYGQMGIGDGSGSATPVQIREIGQVVKIAAGMHHSLALKADGTVWAWGQNASGQLGIGDGPLARTPVRIKGLAEITRISAGMNHSLAVRKDGTLWAWGENRAGQLGDGTFSPRNAPVQVSELSGVTEAAGGQEHSLALLADGTVWAWGSNEYGQLAVAAPPPVLSPQPVSGMSRGRKIAAGAYHSLAVSADGIVYVWGENMDSVSRKTRPYPISYVKDVFDLTAGRYFTILLSKGGS